MKRYFAVLIAFLLLAVLPAALADTTLYVDGHTADRVHLREESSTESDSRGLYFTGTPVTTVGETDNGWTAVVIGTQSGYMKSEYLSEAPVTPKTPGGTVTTSQAGAEVNLRGGPGTDTPIVRSLADGFLLTVYGETKEGWYDVDADGTRGYVKNSLVKVGTGASAQPTAFPDGENSTNNGQVEQTLSAQIDGKSVTVELIRLSYDDFYATATYSIRVTEDGAEKQTFQFKTEGTGAEVGTILNEMYWTDVNMDGYADLAFIRITGATDALASHYLYDPQTGLFTYRAELDLMSIYRCDLYPQGKYILNYLHDGAATGTWALYQWQDGNLMLLARASLLPPQDQTSGERLQAKVEMLASDGWQTVYDQTFKDMSAEVWQLYYDEILENLWNGVEPGTAEPLIPGMF